MVRWMGGFLHSNGTFSRSSHNSGLLSPQQLHNMMGEESDTDFVVKAGILLLYFYGFFSRDTVGNVTIHVRVKAHGVTL